MVCEMRSGGAGMRWRERSREDKWTGGAGEYGGTQETQNKIRVKEKREAQ